MSFKLPPPPPSTKKVYRGDTIVLEAIITQDLVPVDLTGYTILATFKQSLADADDAPTSIQKSIGSGITVVDAPAGEIRITLSPADTIMNTTTVTYKVDIQLKKAGVISTPDDGELTVSLDVTQTS
jgi:hypothetical protein